MHKWVLVLIAESLALLCKGSMIKILFEKFDLGASGIDLN